MPNYIPNAISYVNNGLVKDKDAFNFTDDSFQELENAYSWRGRIKKREGFKLLGRLRRAFTTENLSSYSTINGTNTIAIFTDLGLAATEPNASLESGALTTISIVFPAPIDQTLTWSAATQTASISGAGSTITGATIDYATGTVSITANAAAGPVTPTFTGAYYPGLPVMGLNFRELVPLNAEQTIAFDTKYAYNYSTTNNNFQELASSTPTTWSGGNADFFWCLNYYILSSNKLLWATNFNTSDPIRYYNGTTWTTFNPQIDNAGTPNRLQQARMLVAYRGRVVALNTYEGTSLGSSTQNPQRARWSQLGDPTDLTNGWRSDIAGRGSFIDCPTSEHCVSCEFIRDTLIVYFERSTWKLRYTGNELTPFVWERINKELGAESTFSKISFDEGILAVGDKAITSCNGNGVERIDDSIPDEVFKIHNGSDGVKRVHGIRNFYERLVYWTFPAANQNATFPNRLLVFNYETGAWAIFTDSFTTLGTHQQPDDATWADFTDPLNDTWLATDRSWVSPQYQSNFPNIIAGNQQGFVNLLNQATANQPSLQITSITAGTPVEIKVPNHNLQSGEYVYVSNIIGGYSGLNNSIYQVSVVDSDTLQLYEFVELGVPFNPVTAVSSDYFGLGTLSRVMNFRVRSKKFNLLPVGSQARMGYMDILSEVTDNGEFTCEIYQDYDSSTAMNDGNDTFFNTVVENQIQQFSDPNTTKEWHRVYCNLSAQFVEFLLTFNEEQMSNTTISSSQILIDAFILWFSKGARLQK
jgi:hypothetical protein